MPDTVIQVADRADAPALREKPVQVEQQRVNAAAVFAVTFIRLRGGDWRAVMTVEQWATYARELFQSTALDEPWVDDMTTQSEVSEAPGLARSVVRRSGLRNLRQVRPLIDQVLTRPSATVLVGATGTGKTFLALGFSCSIATGRDWLGHSVTPGPVLYVVGEGASGAPTRDLPRGRRHGTAEPPSPMTGSCSW